MAMITLRDLCKEYRYSSSRHGKRTRQVLDHVGLQVEAGELVAVLGRSGSGKTTLLNIIGGLDHDYEGLVEVDGSCLRELHDAQLSRFRSTTVGFVLQGFHLLDHLSCIDNVTLPSTFARGRAVLDRHAARHRAGQLLDEVGLGELAEHRPGLLSGGEQQRVAIARALFHRPKVLLCDEVTGNLDAQTGAEIIGLLRSLNHSHGVTMVMATHDADISRVAHRVLHLLDGTLTEVDSEGMPSSEDGTP